MILKKLLPEKARLGKVMLRPESATEFEQRRTEFRTYANLRAQFDYIDDQIASQAGACRFTRGRLVATDKDLQ